MEIQKIVIRRPVSTKDKIKGLGIIMSVDTAKFPKTIDAIKSLRLKLIARQGSLGFSMCAI